jgi:hypothetical protein
MVLARKLEEEMSTKTVSLKNSQTTVTVTNGVICLVTRERVEINTGLKASEVKAMAPNQIIPGDKTYNCRAVMCSAEGWEGVAQIFWAVNGQSDGTSVVVKKL